MARHHPDLIMCRKTPGLSKGVLCEKCDGKCILCDSYVGAYREVRVCDECSFGNFARKCLLCGHIGNNLAFYCNKCCLLEKDREGCPKIINLGVSKLDRYFEFKENKKEQ